MRSFRGLSHTILVLGAMAVGVVGLDIGASAQVNALPATPPLIEEVSHLVSKHFYDREAVERVWVQARTAHTAALPADATREEVAAALDAMLDELGASHTEHYSPGELAYYELLDVFARDEFAPRFGSSSPTEKSLTRASAWSRVCWRGGYSSLPSTMAAQPSARACWSVTRSSPPTASRSIPSPCSTTRRGSRSGSRPGVLKPARCSRWRWCPGASGPNEFFLSAMRASVRVIEREGRRWGYVRVWLAARRQYHHLLMEELAEGRLKDADGLVLDLRGGWGGAQPEYTELFVGGAPIMNYVGRDGRENFASFSWRRPVVVLVDEGTRSGKEVVTYGLKRQGVRVVGMRTAGALLAGRGFLLEDGSLLVLAVSDVRVEGERLEGRGVMPDVAVPFRLPYAAGHDPQLEAALAELRCSTMPSMRRPRMPRGPQSCASPRSTLPSWSGWPASPRPSRPRHSVSSARSPSSPAEVRHSLEGQR